MTSRAIEAGDALFELNDSRIWDTEIAAERVVGRYGTLAEAQAAARDEARSSRADAVVVHRPGGDQFDVWTVDELAGPGESVPEIQDPHEDLMNVFTGRGADIRRHSTVNGRVTSVSV